MEAVGYRSARTVRGRRTRGAARSSRCGSAGQAWIRQRKDTRALGNITGARLPELRLDGGRAPLAGSAWSVTSESLFAFASAGIAVHSVMLIFGTVRADGVLTARRLLVGGVLYLGCLVLVVAQVAVGAPMEVH